MISNNHIVSDELLAAYLDGRLDEKKNEYVETAIENSPELQWIVDQWIEERTKSFPSTEVDSISIAKEQDVNSTSNDHLKFRWVWSIAASVLLVFGVSLPLLFKSNIINPDSGMPMDFPVSERYEAEYPNILPPNVTPSDDNFQSEEKFSYEYEIYKTAAIITWNQPLDSARCIAFSNNRQHHFTTYFNGADANKHRIFVVPLSTFDQSEYPIKLILKFAGPDFISTDSISVNL